MYVLYACKIYVRHGIPSALLRSLFPRIEFSAGMSRCLRVAMRQRDTGSNLPPRMLYITHKVSDQDQLQLSNSPFSLMGMEGKTSWLFSSVPGLKTAQQSKYRRWPRIWSFQLQEEMDSKELLMIRSSSHMAMVPVPLAVPFHLFISWLASIMELKVIYSGLPGHPPSKQALSRAKLASFQQGCWFMCLQNRLWVLAVMFSNMPSHHHQSSALRLALAQCNLAVILALEGGVGVSHHCMSADFTFIFL